MHTTIRTRFCIAVSVLLCCWSFGICSYTTAYHSEASSRSFEVSEIDAHHSSANDVTSRVERLGNPFSKGTYARNVWDMQLFAGRIYLGHGNSSNIGPDPNAGPIPVWYYDLTTQTFVKQYTVDEEQIDVYRVFNNTLYLDC